MRAFEVVRMGALIFMRLALVLLICSAAPVEAASSQVPIVRSGPSFSCAAPSPIEAAICADASLSARDRTMAVLFAAARASVTGTGSSSQLAEQRKWLKERDETCGKAKSMTVCLRDRYRYRLYDLAVSTLFTAHDAAIAEFRRQNPDAAQIYQAIYQYATIPSAADRTRIVGSTIATAFEALRIHPEQDVPGIGQVAASPEPLFGGIATAQAAASSDKNFSNFLVVAHGWRFGRAEPRLVIPCAALVRRPGLIETLGARFDPETDCKVMAPATPDLDGLVAAAEQVQPDCDGTIRIDLAASYQRTLTAIRLNLSTEWDGPNKPTFNAENIDEGERKFRAQHRREIVASADEMAKYYAASFGLSPQAARSQGRDVVDIVISGAFDSCE
ncbi:MAG: lysozyme inhibitor LprI family protein [Caulobacteraceae bacterium]